MISVIAGLVVGYLVGRFLSKQVEAFGLLLWEKVKGLYAWAKEKLAKK